MYLSSHTNSKLQTWYAPDLCNFVFFLNCFSFWSMDSCIWQTNMHNKKTPNLGTITQGSILHTGGYMIGFELHMYYQNLSQINSTTKLWKTKLKVFSQQGLVFSGYNWISSVFKQSLNSMCISNVIKPDSLKYLIPITANYSML